MSDKKEKDFPKILFSVLGAGTLFFSVFGQILDFIKDANLIWLPAAIGAIGIGVFVAWLTKKNENKKSEERNRVKSILDEKLYLGEAFSEWMIQNKVDIYHPRINHLLSKINDWGNTIVQALIENEIAIGMTEEMVRLSLGDPNQIMSQEYNEDGNMVNWVYNSNENNIIGIWIKDGVVINIERYTDI